MKQCPLCNECFSSSVWHCPQCHWEPELLEGYLAFSPELENQDERIAPGAHDELVLLEEGSFWFRGRNKLLQFVLNRYFPAAKNLFEIGCGTGFVLAGFEKMRPEIRLVGGEVYPSGLKQAKARVPQAELLQMDACHIPYVDEFDVVGAFDVLEHLDDDQAALREIFKAVKPGGGVILTVPQHQWLWSTFDEIGCHKRRYSRAELKGKVETAGFRIVGISSFVTFLLPLMIISRFKSRSAIGPEKRERVLQEFQLPLLLDLALEKICDLERLLIRLGMTLPVGGSLLCIGEKDKG